MLILIVDGVGRVHCKELPEVLNITVHDLGNCLQVMEGERRINKFKPLVPANRVGQTLKNATRVALVEKLLSLNYVNFI